MKTKIKKNKKIAYLPAALAVTLLLLSVGLFLWHRHNQNRAADTNITSSAIRPSGSIDYSPAKPGDNAANNARKGSPTSSPTIPQSTPSSNGSSSNLSISIAGANRVDSTHISVSANVENATSGTCTFNFSKSDGGSILQTYSEPVQYTGTYYSCPLHTMSMPSGNWYVSAVLSSGGHSAFDKWPSTVTL